jgi:hypothetical protein
MTAHFLEFPGRTFPSQGGAAGVCLDLGDGPFRAFPGARFGRCLGLEVTVAPPKAGIWPLAQQRDFRIARFHDQPRASKNP